MIAIKRAKLFEQVAEVLERRIRDHDLPAGAELPSERDLMKEFGVGARRCAKPCSISKEWASWKCAPGLAPRWLSLPCGG